MKILLKVLNYGFTAALMVLIVASFTLAISARRSGDKIPTVMGHKVMTVLSGSMEPAIHTGDVILVEPTGPDTAYKEGDVITFRVAEQEEMLITHRIIGVMTIKTGRGEKQVYLTKGDANDGQDLAPVTPEQILGVYRGRIPYFGYISRFIRTPMGIVLVVILPGLLLIAQELRKIWRALAEEDAKAKISSQEGR